MLLDKTMHHVAQHGLSDLSLRELATAIGTSHRMLIYHFGGRDGLIAAVVEQMESQQRAQLLELVITAKGPRELIEAQWKQLSDPATRPFVMLFFEVLAMALQQRAGTERFLEQLTTPWLDLGLPADRPDLLLGVAVIRGLLLEGVASGDFELPTEALHRFLDRFDTVRPASSDD